jgi:hypothetical protein
MKEIWKEVHGIEVSNMGNVRLVTKATLRMHCDTFGYPRVACTIDGKRSAKRIHRLVAESFIDNPEGKKEVNHIDGNPKNNHVSNLEWCTHQENMQHAVDTGLRKDQGEKHHWNKLKEHEVLEIYKLRWVYGITNRSIAKMYNISHQHVSDVTRQNRCWQKLNFELTL